jgi:hypothetical protein
MARTFTAQLEQFRDLTEEKIEYVMRQSIMDVLVGAQTTQIGITQGATSFEIGKIPVGLTAELVNSLTVDGATGPDAYIVAIAGMEIGDVVRFAWTAPHAMRIEFGFTGTDSLGRYYQQAGRFFVMHNAAQFPDHVKARVAEVR